MLWCEWCERASLEVSFECLRVWGCVRTCCCAAWRVARRPPATSGSARVKPVRNMVLVAQEANKAREPKGGAA